MKRDKFTTVINGQDSREAAEAKMLAEIENFGWMTREDKQAAASKAVFSSWPSRFGPVHTVVFPTR